MDVWIPATNIGLVNFNDGVLGIFGYVTLLEDFAVSKQFDVGSLRPCWLYVSSGLLSVGRIRLFIVMSILSSVVLASSLCFGWIIHHGVVCIVKTTRRNETKICVTRIIRHSSVQLADFSAEGTLHA